MVFGFLAIILAGAILLCLPYSTRGGDISFIDALFTATSAVCVTGLVVVDTGTFYSVFGQTIIMLLIFAGSLGFMTLATILLLLAGKKVNLSEKLALKQSLNIDSMEGLKALVIKIAIITIIVELIGAIVLSIYFIPVFGWGKGLFYALFHSVSAFGNAGFDLMGDFGSLVSLSGNPIVYITIMTLFILGGLGFFVLIDVYNKKRYKSRLRLHTRVVLTVSLILLISGFLVIFFLEGFNPNSMGDLPLLEKVSLAFFTAATPRTAGFSVLPVNQFLPATQFFIIFLMFIGASPASTGGGIKTTTFGLLVITFLATVRNQKNPVVYGRKISQDLLLKAIAVIIASAALIFAGIFALSLSERKFQFLEIVFETVSAFGTVGLSTGITPELSLLGKSVIIIIMFAGRLGPLTLFIALSKKKKEGNGIDYPYEKIMIG